MAYTITTYTKRKAKEHGLTVKKSKVKGKKIDVFKNGKKVASVGTSCPDHFLRTKKILLQTDFCYRFQQTVVM